MPTSALESCDDTNYKQASKQAWYNKQRQAQLVSNVVHADAAGVQCLCNCHLASTSGAFCVVWLIILLNQQVHHASCHNVQLPRYIVHAIQVAVGTRIDLHVSHVIQTFGFVVCL